MHEQQNMFDLLPRPDEADLLSGQGENGNNGSPVEGSRAGILPSHLLNPYDPNKRKVSEAARDQGHGPYFPSENRSDIPNKKRNKPWTHTPEERAVALARIAEMRDMLNGK